MPGESAAESTAIEAGLQALAAMISTHEDGGPISSAAADALAAAVAFCGQAAPPQGLVARPCPVPAARWHLDRVLSVVPNHPARRIRRAFHARLLGFMLAPDRPEFRPLVTILVPVFNRATVCAQAIESCLAQSWRPLEILVVDDGSTDDLAAALEPFGAALRLLRKPNGGVSSARNMGLATARGDFIHFLDSDDQLLPDAIARKVAAFAAIADAELCYSSTAYRGFPPGPHVRAQPPTGRRRCPTTDLMRAVASCFPFFLSTVMLPRWTALDVGPFEEDLRRSEDLRYYLALGLRGTKAIGLADPMTVRIFSDDSLTESTQPGPALVTLVRLRQLRDVLATTSAWRHADGYLAQVIEYRRLAEGLDSGDPRIAQVIDEVLAAIRQLATAECRDDLSTLPLAASLRHRMNASRSAGRCRPGAASRLTRELPLLLAEAAERAAPLGPADLAFWADRAAHRAERTPIARYLRMLERRYRGDAAILAGASSLLRQSETIPGKRTIRLLVRVRRWFRSIALARRLALLHHRYARSRA